MNPVVLALALFSVAAFAVPDDRYTVARRSGKPHNGWALDARMGEAEPTSPVRFTIYLRQRNLDRLERLFNDVSDPNSPTWGQFVSASEVGRLVSAAPEAFAAVETWLANHTVLEKTFTWDAVVLSMPLVDAEAAFAVNFRWYRHAKQGRSRLLIHGTASLPQFMKAHVHMVGGLSELWHRRNKPLAHGRRSPSASVIQADLDIKVTPAVLREHYGIPEDEANMSPDNYQGIAAFHDYFSQDALSQFQQANNLPSATVDIIGPNCVDNVAKGDKPCDEVESDLDVQFITAIGAGVKTLFHTMNESAWVLDFTEAAVKLSPIPKVFSISYGWAELKQCDIAFESCDSLGYDSKAYVNRTNVGFQKLGAMGVSVLVSDGDDGAQSTSPDGTDPIDSKRWCGASEWMCYPKRNSSCAEINLVATSGDDTGSTCAWPVGTDSDHCSWLFLGDFYQDEDIIKALKQVNPDCALQIFYDGDYGVHLYSECECTSLSPLTHTGKVSVTSEPFKFNKTERLFYADFPTASPYVTSVGATVFKTDDGKKISAEHAASIVDGSIITTGGGFSAIVERPFWQQAAVTKWVNDAPDEVKPPTGTYDATKRGYPDVTLNGHNYQVYLTKSQNTTSCPCKVDGVDGTSASSPALAGMLSLINGALLKAGKTQIGFANPLLYQMYQDSPEAFNDITYGDNKCTRNFCMLYGYNATTGWDPVGGLGTPQFTKMKKYILEKKKV